MGGNYPGSSWSLGLGAPFWQKGLSVVAWRGKDLQPAPGSQLSSRWVLIPVHELWGFVGWRGEVGGLKCCRPE